MRNDLVVLVAYLCVPAHLAITGARTQCFLLAGQANLHRIAIVDGLGEAQVVDTVIREDGTELWVDKQARSKRNDQVAVCDAAIKERIFGRSLFVGVSLKCVAREIREVPDIVERDLAFIRTQGVTDRQLFECLAERVDTRVLLVSAAGPAVASCRQRLW